MAKPKRKSHNTSEENQVPRPGPPPSTSQTAQRDVEMLEDATISDDDEGGTRVGDIYIPPPIKPHCSTESSGPRLIIKKIVNENFKSYAGKVTLGPFHHCFTAIIGPNGSGKSNVIDSMLFVFGYRAQKIRCKKLSVLLHNSARFPNAQMCSVSVHFTQVLDKEDGSCEELENSELVIARTAFRDNSSFYTINGRRVQFKEVAKVLKSHGVDLDHNRFLILQGEVESIAMMKSRGQSDNDCGMLEYLEDIIGTQRYKEPLLKINARAEYLTEERSDKHNRCKLAEREMKDLEQPYNEAIEYLNLENSMTRTKNLQIQKLLSEQKIQLEEYITEKEKIVEELRCHDEHYDQLKKERLEKEEIIKKELEHFDQLCKSKENMEAKLKNATNKYSEVHATMQNLNKRRKQNKEKVQKNETELIELRKVPEKNEREIEESEKRIEQLTSQKNIHDEDLQKNYALLENQTRPLITEREKLETQLVDLKKDVDMANGGLALRESELKLLKHDEVTEKRKYESLKSAYEESKVTLGEKIEQVEADLGNIPSIKEEIVNISKQLKLNKTEEETLRDKLLAIKAEINEKTSSLQTAKSNNQVLDALMRQKHEGKIPGILGRLGNLGGIDVKYDVAISTACGRLDNIIVDTVNTAQQCIEHLKKFDIGRASFIALEKVQHLQRYCDARINTPEDVPRLFDLIEVEDERVLPAFYFALRNTLVAYDLDQGTRIGYGTTRFRVVTLNGDLIEISGTMSGGGRTKLRGKMGTKVQTKTKKSLNASVNSQKALEELQIQGQEMQNRINYLQEQQGLLEKNIQSLKVSLHQKESNVNKIKISINSLSEQLPRLEEQLKIQHQRMEQTVSDPEKVMQLEKEIVSKRKELEVAEKAANKISVKIEEISKKIAEIHGDKITAVQTKITNITKQIGNLTNNISKLKVAIHTSERNSTKLEKDIENLKKDITEAEITIRKMGEERENYDKEGEEWTEKIKEITAEIENARTDSSDIKKAILEIQKKESSGNLKRLEIEQKQQGLEKKISDLKYQTPRLKNSLNPLKLNEIPGETEPQEPLKTYTEEELSAYKSADIQYEISVMEEKLNIKKPNLSVITDYLHKREVYLDRVRILEDITNKRNEMRVLYDDIRKKRYGEFMVGFHIITKKLKEMYQMITQGGDAELELMDSMDPFTEGVSFSVRPPKKTWKNISNLSGGEKTLSSLALVFALHYFKPSPLYFMDEIDAALDFKNISIVAHYIKERTKNAQFIIISLRSNMFELSDYLVGIYKVSDCTNAVTIKNEIPMFVTSEKEDNSNKSSHPAEAARNCNRVNESEKENDSSQA